MRKYRILIKEKIVRELLHTHIYMQNLNAIERLKCKKKEFMGIRTKRQNMYHK